MPPAPCETAGIIAPPGRHEKERSLDPVAAGKWLIATVTDNIPAVITAVSTRPGAATPGTAHPGRAGHRAQSEARPRPETGT
jgi:hypothetical protein